jgi:trk system potassium uptake protein TrkH
MNLNLRYVLRQLGLVLGVLSGCMLLVAVFQALRGYVGAPLDPAAFEALALTIGVGLVLAVALWIFGQYRTLDILGRREALLLVALTWLLGAALAGTPYYLWAWLSGEWPSHPLSSTVSCYFEAMSGLTTTGATVLTDTHSLPPTLLLWRAMTHWLGGLGIVVLFVAVLPSLGVAGKKLYQVEAPGPQAQGVRPRIRQTARLLWTIYLGLTLIEILALHLCGMTWFDSICHTFATLATGGFSTENASIGFYNSAWIDAITMVFMLLAGINFGLYYYLLQGRPRRMWRDPELRLFLIIIVVAVGIVSLSLWGQEIVTTAGHTVQGSFLQALRYGAFQVITIQTTTGFVTADFDQWPLLAKAVLIILMFVGASAGSTGGGIKVIRTLIAGKVMFAEVERIYRPRVVRTIRVGQGVVDAGLRQGVLVYVIYILTLFAIGGILLMLIQPGQSLDMTSAFTASAATLNNIGPGLGAVGAVENYNFFSAGSKLLLSLLMVLGRLELYAIFVLLAPRFWRGD